MGGSTSKPPAGRELLDDSNEILGRSKSYALVERAASLAAVFTGLRALTRLRREAEAKRRPDEQDAEPEPARASSSQKSLTPILMIGLLIALPCAWRALAPAPAAPPPVAVVPPAVGRGRNYALLACGTIVAGACLTRWGPARAQLHHLGAGMAGASSAAPIVAVTPVPPMAAPARALRRVLLFAGGLVPSSPEEWLMAGIEIGLLVGASRAHAAVGRGLAKVRPRVRAARRRRCATRSMRIPPSAHL
jgi:hypothetical protein